MNMWGDLSDKTTKKTRSRVTKGGHDKECSYLLKLKTISLDSEAVLLRELMMSP